MDPPMDVGMGIKNLNSMKTYWDEDRNNVGIGNLKSLPTYCHPYLEAIITLNYMGLKGGMGIEMINGDGVEESKIIPKSDLLSSLLGRP